jgi:hypothetical protein
VEKRKSRKSMLGLLAASYERRITQVQADHVQLSSIGDKQRIATQFFRRGFVQGMGMTPGDRRQHANSPVSRSCCSAPSGIASGTAGPAPTVPGRRRVGRGGPVCSDSFFDLGGTLGSDAAVLIAGSIAK